MVSLPNGRSLFVRLGAVGFAGALAFSSASALAVHEDLEFPVAIHLGNCEEPGDEVVALENLVRLPEDAPDEGERAGAPGSQVVHGLPDDAELDLTVEDLFAEDHILVVFDAEGENIIACGPIGAYTFEDGNDLVFGLRSQGDSPYSGVVLIDNDDDEDDDDADIEIYLVNNTPAPAPEATPIT
ncbi:MAG: hypothetical protein M3440_11290 [Chloroflexota bacterium]|nr:hypothetical protein [Chloroflexota bacterium]